MTSFVRSAALGLTILFAGSLAAAKEQPAKTQQQSQAAKATAEVASTAEILGKLHSANVQEMRMGKLAEEHGRSADVKAYGKTLVEDHDAADTKVAKLAKEEGITLAAHTPPVPAEKNMPMGAGFDAAFAKAMLEDHRKAVAEVKLARDETNDEKLKALLGELLPVLEQHERTAQKLVDQTPKS
jgi:putative membrane protein